jgi:hypothetical protein
VARNLAAQVNGQLASGAPAALSFEPVSLLELRERWLGHHEQVLRSSVHSIRRYRTATEHLFRFVATRPVRTAAQFQTAHAEAFVRYLRTVSVSPNGHPNTAMRPLLDKGVRFVLECCRAMFNYAVKRRHLPPYAENPFAVLEVDRMPIETNDTLVIFVNDNGGERLSDNGPLFHGKYTLWEGGIRVPCIVRYPGTIPADTTSAQPVITMDLTATTLAVAGVALPTGVTLDGEDVLPVLAGKNPIRERTFFWRLPFSGQIVARKGKWKYMNERDVELLFDLETDPGERKTLAFKHPDKVRELRTAYRMTNEGPLHA